ncbi:MAG TPA: 30S ribosomal protein S2 [Candidatus Pacearchaeota archaeon]|jgi:small subunit ribosomal protein S2|nr:30S ribosomal protein S2 [Candidatus Pacearchaeota archaeon]HPC30775.1 30S ribosomal protein S2 [Candidatus Pacearchaeota archaeon]HQH20373.1 30S ribosomal protein S2 [Candidatus Pacearchaeota archaeon]HQK58618.1 30S ribosomal protein S2 [Candidatus Pacearchaeota archaeon]HRU20998.1 30S ribosomal protein S2 [Candidatus Paceibacterota bacterium]
MEETKTDQKTKYNIIVDDLIGAGLGFGHEKSKLHPKMKPYIVKSKDRVYIIDLEQTAEKLEQALDFVQQNRIVGKKILFVGTKAATRGLIEKVAQETKSPYVKERWIGGTFTNFKEIRKRINYFKELEAKTQEINFEQKYVKKERLAIAKELERLRIKFQGIKDMEELPGALFVADVQRDIIAVREANQVGVKTIAIVDTNIDPTLIDYPIPGNDDAYTAVQYVLNKIQEALLGE